MMTVKEVRRWLTTLRDDSDIAIDEGGLTLVEISAGTQETGAYLEVGGIPDDQKEIQMKTVVVTLQSNMGEDVLVFRCQLTDELPWIMRYQDRLFVNTIGNQLVYRETKPADVEAYIV